MYAVKDGEYRKVGRIQNKLSLKGGIPDKFRATRYDIVGDSLGEYYYKGSWRRCGALVFRIAIYQPPSTCFISHRPRQPAGQAAARGLGLYKLLHSRGPAERRPLGARESKAWKWFLWKAGVIPIQR